MDPEGAYFLTKKTKQKKQTNDAHRQFVIENGGVLLLAGLAVNLVLQFVSLLLSLPLYSLCGCQLLNIKSCFKKKKVRRKGSNRIEHKVENRRCVHGPPASGSCQPPYPSASSRFPCSGPGSLLWTFECPPAPAQDPSSGPEDRKRIKLSRLETDSSYFNSHLN